MASSDKESSKSKIGFLTSLVKGSIILQALDRFTSYIYYLLKNGLFGYLFTGYKSRLHSALGERLKKSKFHSHMSEFRYGVCRRVESSMLIAGISYVMKFLLGCRLKVYGVFTLSFGLYTAVVTFITAASQNLYGNLFDNGRIIFALALAAGSVPMLTSKKRFNEALTSSLIGRFILRVTGFDESEVYDIRGEGGHINSAFLLGIICGALTYKLSPVVIVAVFAAAVLGYLVLVRPEIGLLSLFVFMPWLPTMVLAGITIYTTLCYMIKLFRGKRIFRLEPVDILAAAFMIMMFFGGWVSLSSSSLKPALLMVCLMLGYFLTVELFTGREWLIKASVGCVASAVVESVYALILYFTGGGYSSKAWLDDEMFESIGGRAVGSLENPNMLGEYLILIIPIALVMLIGRGEGMRRSSAFISLAVMGACLILTWSRGAWIGLIFAVLVLLLMWHRRSLWLIFAGILSLPFVTSVMPETILQRFTSIGNLSDSSTSYRVHIWRSSVHMIEDNFLSGIGIGEGAWRQIYPIYSLMGVEAAPHSHNLYMQIWLELGVLGLIMFLAFILCLYSSGFTLFAQLSDNGVSIKSDLSKNLLFTGGDRDDLSAERMKTQLRLSSAGPLCGIFAVLVQGMTDYSWYNYRIFLMFWLAAGLASAYVRNGRQIIEENNAAPMGDKYGTSMRVILDPPKKREVKKAEKAEKSARKPARKGKESVKSGRNADKNTAGSGDASDKAAE